MPAIDLQEVLRNLKTAQKKPLGSFEKSTFTESMSATSGLTFYDLELGAKFLYPVLTPLRNMIPRVSGKGGIQANWRAVTAINTQGLRFGVSNANRGGVLAVATTDYSAAYKGIGVETSVDFEAQYAGQGFDDVRAIAAKTGLESLMLGEEAMILGGNASLALGITPTPTLSDVGTGGALAANFALSVICVALTHDGYINATVAGGIQGQITRTNADLTTDTFGGGAARHSTNATITTANDGNATHLVRASVAPVAGALGYAWVLGCGGRRGAGRADRDRIGRHRRGRDRNADGRVSRRRRQLAERARLRRPLDPGTSSGLGRQHRHPVAGNRRHRHAADLRRSRRHRRDRRDPQDHVGCPPALTGHDLGLVAGGAQHLAQDRDGRRRHRDAIRPRRVRRSHRWRRDGADIPQPLLDAGRQRHRHQGASEHAGRHAADDDGDPAYPLSGVGNLMQIRTRQDYYQIEWPLRTRRYEYGIYADEVLQHYFPPAMAVITNIGNG
jgi:hypothetical protein